MRIARGEIARREKIAIVAAFDARRLSERPRSRAITVIVRYHRAGLYAYDSSQIIPRYVPRREIDHRASDALTLVE